MNTERLNPICAACALCGNECQGTTCQTWTGCASRTAPDKAYTVKLNGKYYAPMMDSFAHYVFGAGPDAGKHARIEDTPGSTAGRNAAILAICTPCATWSEAYRIAHDTGRFAGELFP